MLKWLGLQIIKQFSLLEIDNNQLNYFNYVFECTKYVIIVKRKHIV